jgi:DNA excision repair protein ERCC-1
VLTAIHAHAWEYSDIPADFVLGATTCALFLSLKYHRLHPEYIYNRIRGLQGKYNLRLLLVMVDIENHEESLKELSKTSLINNVTIILSWSAAEAGRWLELYKTYEHAPPTAIRAQQSKGDGDRVIDFITTPRSINKTDAVALVSNFGSVRTAVNATPEEVLLLPGWGEKKVQRWCQAVREPFRIQKAAKRGITTDDSRPSEATPALSRDVARAEGKADEDIIQSRVGAPILPNDDMPRPTSASNATPDTDRRAPVRAAGDVDMTLPVEEEEAALIEAALEQSKIQSAVNPSAWGAALRRKRPASPEMTDGVMAALAKLRDNS